MQLFRDDFDKAVIKLIGLYYANVVASCFFGQKDNVCFVDKVQLVCPMTVESGNGMDQVQFDDLPAVL